MTPTQPLSILIVGAGLGGLSAAIAVRRAGHRVVVLEQAPQLGEVGAGIQVAPNAARLLAQWGVIDELGPRATPAHASNRRRWADGRLLGSFPMGPALLEHYGAPYLCAHRADLHRALVAVAAGAGGPGAPVEIRLGRRVVAADPAGPAVVLADGERIAADVVVAADGIGSPVRESLIDVPEAPFSGQVTRRMIVHVDPLRDQPGFDDLLGNPCLDIWLGPGRHCVSHPVFGGSHVYLGVTVEAERWVPGTMESREQLLEDMAEWDPRLRTLIAAAPEMTAWPLFDREPLERWAFGAVALMGDACHPLLPFQAQGAAQAIEDGATLGAQLAGVERDGAAAALARYATARRGRAVAVQRASRANGGAFHLPDGPDQEARDVRLRRGDGDFESYRWLWSAHPDGTPLAALAG